MIARACEALRNNLREPTPLSDHRGRRGSGCQARMVACSRRTAAISVPTKTAAIKQEAISPENKCGMPSLPWARSMIARSYSRELALQLNFM